MLQDATSPFIGRRIRVRGMVQGVGFRPTVWRLAAHCGIAGEVRNDGEGLLIEAWGTERSLDEFTHRVGSEAPPLARVDAIESTAMERGQAPRAFVIGASTGGAVRTAIVPDTATCVACLRELRDPADRRFGYAFGNCTHCGPRLSIIQSVPYDRRRTTMDAFAMCARCRSEYEDSADRRFHAQPIACATCGPRPWLEDASGSLLLDDSNGALNAARDTLREGGIVGIKGLGGFHLACNALDPEAVARLRKRKRRDAKPLALMARDLDAARRFCAVAPLEAEWLCGSAAPLVILRANGKDRVAPQVAPGMASLAFMLPHTPLHHLLLADLEGPVVMTSGNVSDEPQCIDNDEARRRLEPLVDRLLLHDRGIAHRVDDSLMRVVGGSMRMLRRGRGFAPAPVRLPEGFELAPEILAMGGELKNTFCFVKGGEAIVSQHIGDLEAVAAHEEFRTSLGLLADMLGAVPTAIAVDLHPEYLSTKIGRQRAELDGLTFVKVQHHHAHIASALVENGWPLQAPRVLGIVLDGLGYGADGSLWGGEFLLANYLRFERLARLKPVVMLGGAQATRQPWRSAYAHLCAAMGWPRVAHEFGFLELCRFLATRPLAAVDSMQAAGLQSPLASSCGRLFDAVAAALGICRDRACYEGQAAIELETLAEGGTLHPADPGYPFARSAAPLAELDPAPMWQALLLDLARETPREVVALRFHRGLARALVATAEALAGKQDARRFDTVALTGGVFQNRLLFEAVHDGLAAADFRVLTNSRFPCHDGGLSLGQAAIAAAHALQAHAAPKEELACA